MINFESKLKEKGVDINFPRAYASATVRNGVIEDYHSEGVILNRADGRVIFTDIASRIFAYLQLREEAIRFAEGNVDENSFAAMNVYLKQMAFADILANGWHQPFDHTNFAKYYIRETKKMKKVAWNEMTLDKIAIGLANYLYSGWIDISVKKGCQLTDERMKQINTEVYNKYYTLAKHYTQGDIWFCREVIQAYYATMKWEPEIDMDVVGEIFAVGYVEG